MLFEATTIFVIVGIVKSVYTFELSVVAETSRALFPLASEQLIVNVTNPS